MRLIKKRRYTKQYAPKYTKPKRRAKRGWLKRNRKTIRRVGLGLGAAGLAAAGLYTGGDLVPFLGSAGAGLVERLPGIATGLKTGKRAQQALQALGAQEGRIGSLARGFRNRLTSAGGNWTAGNENMDWSSHVRNAAFTQVQNMAHRAIENAAVVPFIHDKHALPSDDVKVMAVRRVAVPNMKDGRGTPQRFSREIKTSTVLALPRKTYRRNRAMDYNQVMAYYEKRKDVSGRSRRPTKRRHTNYDDL